MRLERLILITLVLTIALSLVGKYPVLSALVVMAGTVELSAEKLIEKTDVEPHV